MRQFDWTHPQPPLSGREQQSRGARLKANKSTLALAMSFNILSPLAGMFPVTTAFETPLVGSKGDSADDPAIYIGMNGAGFIAGTDKQSGLHIYTLKGEAREFFPLGMVNNVDLREKFSVEGNEFDLRLLGDFNIENALAAICVGKLEKISFSNILCQSIY